MNVKIVTIVVKKKKMQDLLIQTRQENKQLKIYIKIWIEFKDNMVEKLQKAGE